MMICNNLLINGELVDYKLSDSVKDISDFNKSLIAAGYPFWQIQGVEIISYMCYTQEDVMRCLSMFRLSPRRCFISPEDEFSTSKTTTCCKNCGCVLKHSYNFCPLCGEEKG